MPRWVVPFVLGSVVLSDRAIVGVASGGHGVFQLLAIAAPLAALFAMLRYGLSRSLGFLVHPGFVLAVLPYLVLTAVLPILGVMGHGYPERTLLSVTETTTAISFLVLGAIASTTDKRSWVPWLMLAIALELAYALGQEVYLSRGPGWEILQPLASWDYALAQLQGQVGSQGRSTGLFTNPNDLGLWAAVAVVLAWTLLSGAWRGVGGALAVMTLLLSQSRGAVVALVAALVAAASLGVARRLLGSASTTRTPFNGSLIGALVGALVVLIGVGLATLDTPLDRFGALAQVLTEGPQADANLAGRIQLWAGVIALGSVYPWGTWGSPELALGTAVDNAWFRVLAQGSVIYLLALAAVVTAGLTLRNTRYGDALRLACVVIAVAGVTQTPFGSSVIVVFWFLIGIYLQSSVTRRRATRSEHPDPFESGAAFRKTAHPDPT